MSPKPLAALAILLLVAAPPASAQERSDQVGIESCYALGRESLTLRQEDLRGLGREAILRRLGRQLTYDVEQPGVKAMLACIMRRTAQ